MDELIKRSEAIDALDEIEAEVADGYGYQYAKWRGYFAKMPAVDAVPVVRCRDCKYWDTVSGSTFAPTHHQCQIINLMSIGTWYCASGERKDGKEKA